MLTAHSDDVTYALKTVSGLGNGFSVLVVGSTTMVVSVPTELNRDHVAIMELAAQPSAGGAVSVQSLVKTLHWPRHRIDAVLVRAHTHAPIGSPEHNSHSLVCLFLLGFRI